MNKTVNINIGGLFFHIDEDAYQKLSRYFDAIKRSLSNSSGKDEIMKDIEMRVAELLTEQQKSDKHVINLKDVDQVVAVMGQPEDYRIDDDNQEPSSANFTSSGRKKLYRDKDNGLIGGVCTGLGHYFGIDSIWIKIGFILLVWAGGSGILAYLILWAITPKAVTTSEKLEMTGEPVTISNIEKKVREEYESVSSKFKNANYDEMGNQVKNGAEKVANGFGNVIMKIFGAFAKVLGAFILISSALSLVTVIVVSIVMVFSSSMPDNKIVELFETPLGLETPLWAQGILFLLGFGIPLFFLFILGLKLMVNNLRSIGNYIKYSLLAVWIVAVGIIISLGINEASQLAFDGKSVQKEVIAIAPTDTLKIKFKNNDFYSKSNYRHHDFKITQDEGDNEIIYSNNVSIEIKYTDEATPYMLIEKLANGKSTSQAKKRAEKIRYNYKIEGNTIVLDNYLLTAVENKFRGQEVEIYLYLPKGTIFQTDESYSNYDRSDYDFFDENEYDTKNPVYQVDSDKIRCLNCLESDSNNDLSIKVETGDTSASIYYDENGVLVKKVVNTEEKGIVTKKEEYIIEADEVDKKVYQEIKEKKK